MADLVSTQAAALRLGLGSIPISAATATSTRPVGGVSWRS